MMGIYEWTVERPDQSVLVYVGQSRKIEKRRMDYIYDWQGRNVPRTNSVLEVVDDPEQLTERERYWYHRRVAELGWENIANEVEPADSPMSDPDVRRRAIEASAAVKQPTECRLAHYEGNRRRFDDDEWLGYRSELNRQIANDPEWQQRNKEAAAQRASPDGTVYAPIVNLTAFRREHGLSQGSMHLVLTGKRQFHKGWRRYDGGDIDA